MLLTSSGDSFGSQSQEALLLQDETGANEDAGTYCQSQAEVESVLESSRRGKAQVCVVGSPVHTSEGRRAGFSLFVVRPHAGQSRQGQRPQHLGGGKKAEQVVYQPGTALNEPPLCSFLHLPWVLLFSDPADNSWSANTKSEQWSQFCPQFWQVPLSPPNPTSRSVYLICIFALHCLC